MAIRLLHTISPSHSQAFNVVFHKAVEMAEASEDVKSRVNTLIDCVTFSTFNYISRGLFERDKLTFTAQLAFQVRMCVSECLKRVYVCLFHARLYSSLIL